MKKIARWEKYVFVLILSSIVFFILGNAGLNLTNPDEVFYAGSAKEMAQHNSWLTPYLFDKPQFEKPIFTYWLIRLAFLMFGNNNFSARIFPALFGLAGMIAVYILAMAGLRERKKAFFSALILGSSALYLGLTRTIFTDLIFSVLILSALASFYWGYAKGGKNTAIILFFVFSALAVLTKGPLGIIIPGLTVIIFLALSKELDFIICPAAFWGMVVFAVIAVPWYAFMLKTYGNGFIKEFWVNDHIRRIFEAEHRKADRWYFYPLTMLGCMYPWSLYVAAGLWSVLRRLKKQASAFPLFLACWLGVVLAIFVPAHSKLTTYIFPLFPALALAAGDFMVDKIFNPKSRSARALGWATALSLLVIPVAVRVAAVKYPFYFISSGLTMILAVISWAFAFISLLFVFLKNHRAAFFIQMGLLPALLIAAPFTTNIDPYVSSREAGVYLATQPVGKSVVLCSKFFVRGVRFYTGYRTAVFDPSSDNFFSPHPIPFLNSELKLREFLASQPVTYCVLKKKALDDLERLAGNRYQSTLLTVEGDEYIYKVEPRK
jgi:4-amino-4-deoxy-L-arabinose transferase-like glycosyltransferase